MRTVHQPFLTRTITTRAGIAALVGVASTLAACGHKHTTVIEDRRTDQPKVVERKRIIERDRPGTTTYERTETITERR